MIHVKRIPNKLDFITTKGFAAKLQKEFDEAKVHFTNGKKATFKFDCYRHPQIKEKLVALFKGKCAYCDSNITHITAGDIEHFRPKSAYWWLACDWDNLLFACEKCNRTGKNDAFPLLNNAVTQCKYNKKALLEAEDKKERLLLNPCVEDPEQFFDYDEKTAVVHPKTGHPKSSKERLMADQSIATYQLQRRELVQEREKLLILLFAQIDYTKKIIENYNRLSGFTASVKAPFETRMKEEITKLLEFNRPDRPYLGLVRQVLRKFFLDNSLPLHHSLQTTVVSQ
jgi:uncharacterized protein (TIGR02646 family)